MPHGNYLIYLKVKEFNELADLKGRDLVRLCKKREIQLLENPNIEKWSELFKVIKDGKM